MTLLINFPQKHCCGVVQAHSHRAVVFVEMVVPSLWDEHEVWRCEGEQFAVRKTHSYCHQPRASTVSRFAGISSSSGLSAQVPGPKAGALAKPPFNLHVSSFLAAVARRGTLLRHGEFLDGVDTLLPSLFSSTSLAEHDLHVTISDRRWARVLQHETRTDLGFA